MPDNAYRPGSWFAAVGPSVVVFVDDTLQPDRMASLWQAVSSGAPVDRILEVVTGGDVSDPPAFGLAVRDGKHVRVLFRTGVMTVVTDASGNRRTIDSGGVSTNIEYLAESVSAVAIARVGASADGLVLPLAAGIVVADSVEWVTSRVADGRAAAQPAAAAPRGAERPAVTQVVPPAARETGNVMIDLVPAGARRNGSAEEPGTTTAEAGPAAAAESDSSADHDGFTQAGSTMTAVRPTAVSAPMVPAVKCSRGHVSRPDAKRCRICSEVLREQETQMVPRPDLGSLRFSTGQVVQIDRRIVVGRSPSVERVSGEDLPELVQVDSPDQDISRNHVEVRLYGWDVVVVDLDSVNGTDVVLPGRNPERLKPGQPFPLVPGAIVDVAGEVTFSYEIPT